MNKLNRRNFLKGLGLSGLGLGLFRFNPKEDKAEVIDLPEVEMVVDKTEYNQVPMYQIPSYTITTSSTGIQAGQIVYVGSNGTFTTTPNGTPIGISTSDNAIMIKGGIRA